MDRYTAEILEGLRRAGTNSPTEPQSEDECKYEDEDEDMNLTVFNTPIGYLKRPLFQDTTTITSSSPQDRVIRPLLESKHYRPTSNETQGCSANESSTLDIANLPIEIMERISLFLSQGDCLKIMLLNKSCCNVMKTRLYRNIVVDSQVDLFSKDDPTRTYINSSYGFKRFLQKACIEDFSFVQNLVVMEYFDMNHYERQFQALISQCLSHLNHIRHLEWLPELNSLMLSQLPNLRQLQVLRVSLPENTPSVEAERLSLHNLKVLEVLAYHDCDVLNSFLRKLDLDPQKLDCIQLHRYKKGKIYDHSMNPTAVELSRNQATINRDHELQQVIKHTPMTCEQLKELVLDHIHVSHRLFESLKLHFPLFHNLTRLKLTNVVEYLGGGELMLHQLSKVVRPENLIALSIDWREANQDTVAEFINGLGGLQELDVVIRFNYTKGVTIDETLDQYVKAIVASFRTLHKLSLELKVEQQNGTESFGDLNNPVMDQLVDLHLLESLRIPVRQGGGMHERLAWMIPQMAQLRYLDLVGGGSGGQPNLGMGMIHPCVYDEWFKVQHVAILYCQMNDQLRYVRCNKRVFYCNKLGIVEPKTWLDKWFDKRVRV
ncbi:uncharacterized protein KQ657_003093 [Scheffersomyces spartinae]|uniref:F-box domain-containing protein n=1 Tax=Scheffersomyces spartinae TaxID=45513 RepID=A0A9P8AFZ6_9ASCO|nr:uncharacterized protein KQ657_003093 [Scheffersomyces spartinae]KAG7191498.1 hypothetical protein KQ657_003093 [Scheffersomyces spartinae]